VGNSFVIWGGYGGHNLGDEAILWAMSRLIRKLRPTALQYVLIRGGIAERVAAQYRAWGMEPVSFPSVRSLKLLRRSHLIVGGGQLLDDKTLVWPVGWTSLLLLANRMLGLRTLVLCIGAEPISRRITRMLVRHFYSLAAICTCRDGASVDVLRSCGFPEEKLYATRDVVFSLNNDVFPRRVQSTDSTPRITIVVSHDPDRTPRKAEYFSELAQRFLKAGCHVCLTAHDLRIDYDLGLLLRLEGEFRGDSRVTFCKPESVADVLNAYSSSDAVVSIRMHPLILASISGSLPVAISHTAKVRSLAVDLGIPTLSECNSSIYRATDILALLSAKDAYLQAIADRLAEFRSTVESTTSQALTI
jgi:polysaccharide pyruvyl transferase WcaK-like protein